MLAISILALAAAPTAQTLFVDATLSTGANDGSSWADAYQGGDGLRSALAAASPGTEIWATGGTYRSLPAAPAGFDVQAPAVTLRGGFAGGESTVFERPEPGVLPTVLSGDALGDDDGTPSTLVDNAMITLRCDGQEGWIMERVHVTAARDIGFLASDSGVRVGQCAFTDCAGRGAVVQNPDVFTTAGVIVDSRFAFNASGGLFYRGRPEDVSGASIGVDRCLFEHNGSYGLNLSHLSPWPVIAANCISRDNMGIGVDVADLFSGNRTILSRLTIVGNAGPGIEYDPSTCGFCTGLEARDVLVWDNGSGISVVATSPLLGLTVAGGLIQGTPAAASLTTDDIFEDYAAGDLRPAAGSPAIDAGTTFPTSTSPDPLDFARARRVHDDPSAPGGSTAASAADMGALERSPFIGRYGECLATPNSTGARGRISASGDLGVAAGDLTLTATSLPPLQFGIFLASQSAGDTPMAAGPGTLCLSGDVGRFNLPGQVLSAGASGSFSLAVDLGRIPQPSTFAQVQPGETWRFQAWHRDVLPGGGPTSQFTDAVAVPYE